MAELMDILSKGSLQLSAETQITVDDTAWVTIPLDELALDRGSAVTVDAATHSITVNESGPYSASTFINAGFAGQDEMRVSFSVNGADPTRWMQEQGRGAGKPIDFSYYGIHNLTAGDVITVVARMETGSHNVNLLSGSFIIAKEF